MIIELKYNKSAIIGINYNKINRNILTFYVKNKKDFKNIC